MRRFSDPTSDDSDFMPLTPEERKLIKKYCARTLTILITAGLIIYMLWKL